MHGRARTHTATALYFPRVHESLVETESPEQAGASWVGQQGLDGGAWLVSISPRCQTPLCAKAGAGWGGGGAGLGMGSRRLREVFAALLGLLEREVSVGAGSPPDPGIGCLKTQGALSKWLPKGLSGRSHPPMPGRVGGSKSRWAPETPKRDLSPPWCGVMGVESQEPLGREGERAPLGGGRRERAPLCPGGGRQRKCRREAWRRAGERDPARAQGRRGAERRLRVPDPRRARPSVERGAPAPGARPLEAPTGRSGPGGHTSR